MLKSLLRTCSLLLLSMLSSHQVVGATAESTAATSNLPAAEAFISAFYSYQPEPLRKILSGAASSQPVILYYQGWAEGGNYHVVDRQPCADVSTSATDNTVSCAITVADDLIAALGIEFHVTDVFTLVFSAGELIAVTTSSNDPPVFHEAMTWLQTQRPNLIAEPCEGFFAGGPSPGDCVRAVVKGFTEFRLQQAAAEQNTQEH